MIIGAVKEKKKFENRVSISPDDVKNYVKAGHQVFIEKGAGSLSGFNDKSYKESGASLTTSKDVYKNSNIILKINCPTPDESKLIKNNSMVISQISIQNNQDSIKILNSKKISAFALELVPRITRAQDMDILSSQANLAGYHAVIDAAQEFNRVLPLFMTAAGKVTPANVLVIGAGVAGLQAIATAKRMGAIVYATDVRLASKEQVESLGGKFLTVEGSENLETEGGYAKETNDDFKKKQEELLKETLKKIDIIVCTALIPGKKAPIIIKKDMIDVMQSGSIIYDLAASQGGNSELTKVNQVVDNNGVKIMGEANILNKLPVSASNLYAKNMFNFISNLFDKEKKSFEINLEDEIIEKTMVK